MASRLAITCGDPAGIGPEVISAWLAAHPAEAGDVALIGPARWLEGLPGPGARIPVGLDGFSAEPGRPDGEGSLVAWAAMERAAEGCRTGEFSGVVTGPVSKERLAGIGWRFPGQTEFFAARWGGEPTMAFCGGRLRVALLTWHVPFRKVPDYLTPAHFARAVAAAAALGAGVRVLEARSDVAGVPDPGAWGPISDPQSPVSNRPGRGLGPRLQPSHDPLSAVRIGVCGLNPHAGEAGLIGTEERDIIDPILDGLRARYPGLSRALPGDTVFARQLRGEFDVVLALYHDQGLAPLKTLEFDEAVNVTLGLPHVRTSPDHGTTYDIAGRGIASARSFAAAVEVAKRMISS